MAWKGVLAITYLASQNPSVNSDLGHDGAIQLLLQMWTQWPDVEMRQQILWAFGQLV
jgi:hypothetical protein